MQTLHLNFADQIIFLSHDVKSEFRMDISGHWRPWEDGCCSKKLKQIWNQRTCENWKGKIRVCMLCVCVY